MPAPSFRLRSWRVPLVVALVGALVVGIAWWVDQRGRADIGVVDTSAKVQFGDSIDTSFTVPGGRVQVSVEVGTETDGDVRTPRDGRLVEVGWSGIQDRAGSQDELLREPPKSSTLTVRSGHRRFRVADDVRLESAQPAPDENRPHAVLAVPGAGQDLVVELAYAGRRQSVAVPTGERVLGSFASLYRPSPDYVGAPDTARQTRGGLEWRTTARAGWQRRPYVAGLGWAKPGKEWLVLGRTSLRVNDIERASTSEDEKHIRYEPDRTESDRRTAGEGRLSVEGGRAVRKPATALSADGIDAVVYQPGAAVFEVDRGAATSLRMTVRTTARPEDSAGSSRSAALVATRTVPIEPVLESGADR